MSPPEPHDFGAELESGQIGRFRVRRRGSAKFDFLDPFYLGLTLSWPIFLAVVLGGLAAINIAFAGLYGCSPGAVQNLRRGDWLHALFFSAETFSTVGYGAMFPASVYGHTVATVEMITGLFFDALLTGLIFVRFSRPRSHIVIADHAVINSSDGVTTLQIRLANGRDALLTGVSARLGAVKGEPHAAPGAAWDVQELKLQSGQMSVLPLTWTLVHRIEEEVRSMVWARTSWRMRDGKSTSSSGRTMKRWARAWGRCAVSAQPPSTLISATTRRSRETGGGA